MASLHQVLKHKYHRIIVTGYIAQNCKYYLSIKIIESIFKYYHTRNLQLNIKLDKKKLFQFKNAASSDHLYMIRVPFTIDRFKFNICLSPNYYKQYEIITPGNITVGGDCDHSPDPTDNIIKYMVAFGITLTKFSTKIKHIIINYKLFCKQTNSEYSGIKIFKHENDNAEWPQNMLALNSCKPFDILDFSVNIDVLQIEYKSFYFKPIHISSVTEFKLTIDDIMLKKYAQIDPISKSKTKGNDVDPKPFYTKIFNQCYGISFIPTFDNNSWSYDINLNLCALPPNIMAMQINVIFIDNNNKTYIKQHVFKHNDDYDQDQDLIINNDEINDGSEYLKLAQIPIDNLKDNENDNRFFNLRIAIENIYDLKGKLIAIKHWKKYNILSKHKCFDYQYNNKLYNNYIDRNKHIALKWIISGLSLNRFCNTFKYKLYKSEYLEILNGKIGFDICLYPNGINTNASSVTFVQFYIILSKLPTNIKSIVIHYRLYCKEFKIKYKNIGKYDKIGKGLCWPLHTLSLQKCKLNRTKKSIEQLTFEMDLNIINIEYDNNDENTENYYKILSTKLETYYKWNINTKLLKKFNKAQIGQIFHSETFENIWCLDICPNGFNEKDKGSIRLSLVLLSLPPKIKSLKVNILFQAHFKSKNKNTKNEEIIKYQHKFKFDYDKNRICSWPKKLVFLDDINNNYKKLKYFTILIKIIKVQDVNSKNIKINQWPNYGIFDVSQNHNDLKLVQQHNNKDYDREIEWKLIDNKLSKFLRTDEFTKYGYKTFKLMEKIHCNLGLYPHGKSGITNSDDRVIFEFAVKRIPFDIDMIKLLVVLKCKETISEYMMVQTFKPSTLHKCNKVIWDRNCLRFEECKGNNIKALTFSCLLQVLSIKYNGTHVTKTNNLKKSYLNYYKPIIMNEHIEFRWNIGGDILKNFLDPKDKLRLSEPQRLYSPKLNDCWMFTIENDDDIALYLELYGLSPMISTIKIRIITRSNYNDEREISEHIFSYNNNKYKLKYQLSTLLSGITAYLSGISDILSFIGIISIIEIIDIKGYIVKKCDWHKYNVKCLP